MENIRILVVDDQTAMRSFIKATIKAGFPAGLDVAEAGGGEAATHELLATPCDIVICDINMPGMKGMEVLKWVREQEGMEDTQFLMLTASHEKDVVMEAVKTGTNDFIVKPVTADILCRRLQMALDRTLAARRGKAKFYAAGEADKPRDKEKGKE